MTTTHNFETSSARGMAFDSPSHARNGVMMTRGGSMISTRDWPKVRKQLVTDDMPTRHKVSTPSAVDDEDGLGKFRSYLKGHGIGDADIEKAVEHFKRDAEARDRMPANGLPSHGGMGGHLSGASKDTDFDFVETEPDVDYGGQRPSELRGPYGAPTGTSQHFSETRKLGELAAARLEGGGVSRRLSNDSALTSDESFEADYPGISNTKVGMFA